MKSLKNFLMTAVYGGFGVLLPLLILFIVFGILFRFITNSIEPIANALGVDEISSGFIADVLSIVVVVLICFLVGLLVKTKRGNIYHLLLEEKLLMRIPGYNMVRDNIKYFDGSQEKPFTTFALVKPFGTDTLVNGFITDTHDDGSYSVFVPQGPITTQGDIYHMAAKDVFILDVPVGDGMKSVTGMGTNSRGLLKKYREQYID
jgi:uncharacterized membrane protein